VIGLGEVGHPLLHILSRTFACEGIDLQPVEIHQPCSVLHICYPFQIAAFIATTAAYIDKYRPRLTIIHSTVAPGTLRAVEDATNGAAVAYSPVRGKHARMESELLHYTKFVASSRPTVSQGAVEHLRAAGFKTDTFRTPEIAELSKLLETTYLGILIAWAQEMERFAAQHSASAEEIKAFFQEIDFLPSNIFPGHIGGHCVMPNIEILRSQFQSHFLDAVVDSNERKHQQLLALSSR
jgi:UDP-N-acetyl-D-mannosaminuronate dehydrogenase